MSSDEFQLNDPVTIESTTDSSSTLEGIVAHLGSVQFAPGTDWIGIRLTGTSTGKGKNDGTVKGVKYFNVGSSASSGGEKNGMFVKKSNVKKRELNRLEKLRLKRELSEIGSTSVTASSSRSSSARASITPKASAS